LTPPIDADDDLELTPPNEAKFKQSGWDSQRYRQPSRVWAARRDVETAIQRTPERLSHAGRHLQWSPFVLGLQVEASKSVAEIQPNKPSPVDNSDQDPYRRLGYWLSRNAI